MTEIKAKKVLFKNRDGEHLIPYVGDTAIENRITNCLLEVPQNIKLELNNGTLTLKAGSKVIVPNGAGTFEDVTITKDLSTTGYHDGKIIVFAQLNSVGGNNIVGITEALVSNCTSGSTNPTNGIYYNISSNTICRYTNSVADLQFALPLAICTRTSGVITSIDQLFNGMGYIGSTIFVDKGVKGLVPNGRNADGSLRNIEYTTNTVAISDRSVLDGENRAFLLNYKKNVLEDKAYSEDNKTIAGSGQYIYNPITNYIYNSGGTKGLWVLCGYYSSTDGKITSFKPKLPFRAVDYNDYRTEVDSKVSKTGDTMTGPLFIQSSTGSTLILKSDNVDKTQAPSANVGIPLRMYDKNNQQVGLLEQWNYTTGEKRMSMRALNSISGTEKTCQIVVAVDANGNAFTAAPTPATGDNSTKIATTAYCVNMRCTTKATTTSSASATRPAWIVQNYVNGTSWYRVWSDGWIEQGGLVNGGNNTDTVTLLKSFTNANYSVMTSLKHTATQAAYAIIVSNMSTTGFTLFTYSGGAKECSKSWYACGY